MKVTKIVYYGGVEQHGKSIKIFFSSSKKTLFQDINNWIFDYLFRTGRPIKQLPPLDDWSRNGENPLYWAVQFPSDDWKVWISSDYIDFD